MSIKIYGSKVVHDAWNCLYSKTIVVDKDSDFSKIFKFDYVGALYKGNYRSTDNYLESEALIMDIDNDHSNNPEHWIDVDDIKKEFEGVEMFIHYSTHHWTQKKEASPRPRFHVGFKTKRCADSKAHAFLKQRINKAFPFFDKNAFDAARFFYGTADAKGEYIEGTMTIDDYLEEVEFDDVKTDIIPVRQRNSTLSRFAAIMLKLHGEEDAYPLFQERATHCEVPLEDKELDTIWKSALKFYKNKILTNPDYVPPSLYIDTNSYKPSDYSDTGQANVFSKYFKDFVRFNPGTGYLVYEDGVWKEDDVAAVGMMQELTERQLKEAQQIIARAYKKLSDSGATETIKSTPKSKVEGALNGEEQLKAYHEYLDGLNYQAFVIKRRDYHFIDCGLKAARNSVSVAIMDLDSEPYLLNTPAGTIDLNEGITSIREHHSSDLITKITKVSPSEKGKDIWLAALKKIFVSEELIKYVQAICGNALIGEVRKERCIIAFGNGGNGKSTFFNAIATVLGGYSGGLSSDVLTTNAKRNVLPDFAELRGKRMVIAAETQEGARLDESVLKRICSTDKITASKKFKDQIEFYPSHLLILYTNHLPKVSANDDGTWRRMEVIPFLNKLTGSGDIKNYAKFLVEEAGEYILYWLIEGAKMSIECGDEPEKPEEVVKATAEYREQNNWFNHFLTDRCDITDKTAETSSGELYSSYRNYAISCGEFVKSTTDFYQALDAIGLTKINRHNKKIYKGIKLIACDGDFEDDNILN